MVHVTFAFWLFLILFAGAGIYRMLCGFGKSRWVDWALLPGTIVSEMAYIFGSLITGGEVRRAKLIGSGQGRGGGTAAGTETAPKLKVIGPVLAALAAIVACMAAIVVVHALLGEPVIKEFLTGEGPLPGTPQMLPKVLPTSWDALWETLGGQISLLRRMAETLGRAHWLDWRVPLFVYLSLCLSIRLAPVSRPMRPTLGAAAAVAVLIAVAGLISDTFKNLVVDLWPLLTYVWSSLLFLLALTLLIRGVIHLVGVLTGKRRT